MNFAKSAFFLVLFLVLVISSCVAFEEDLKDGTYFGEHSFVKVELTVTGGRVSGIEILSHGGGGERYAAMVRPLTGKMVDAQSTSVDAVTGATVSSNYLKKAVEDALGKARD